MPNVRREAAGGIVYHVFNRAIARLQIFEDPNDYKAFERVLLEAHEQVAMRTVAYRLMPNHWHLVLWPREDGDLSAFMHWLTMTHVQRWHAFRRTTGSGHLYQGRFKGFPVQSDEHFLTVCRYVERNALRAGLVARAENWQWCSLNRRHFGDAKERAVLSDGPLAWPRDWLAEVNLPQTEEELAALRRCLARGRPLGAETWVTQIASRLGLESTLRPRGRPPQRGQSRRE